MAAIHEIKQHSDYPFDVFQVGDQVGIRGWSDVDPGTVVKVSPNGKRVWVQEDDAELLNAEDLKFHVGGFAAHCSNQHEQRYEYRRNENGRIRQFSLRVWRGRYCWTPLGGNPDGIQRLSKGWKKFYDYNF